MDGDFRTFLRQLESKGSLKRIKKQVDTKFEIAAYTRKSSDSNGPAFIFENVKNYPGWKVAGAVYATYDRVSTALGTTVRDCWKKFDQAIRNPIPWVERGQAPCQERVIAEREIDLATLPAVWHSAQDPGYYITGGLQTVRDPQTQNQRLGMHRLCIRDRKSMIISSGSWERWFSDFDEPVEMATIIGAGPYMDMASQAKVSEQNKFAIAGGLRGKPVEVVKCKTLDLMVPADAEMIIESKVYFSKREMEGPFGEVAGVYGDKSHKPTVQVTAVTMRGDAMFQDILTGMPVTENHVVAWPAVTEEVYRAASMATPEVTSVNVWDGYYTAIVGVKKRAKREAVNVIHAVLGGAKFTKYCIVVDDDIDVFNRDEVFWALTTRVQPDQNVFVLPIMLGSPLDPSAPLPNHSSKMGIDATIPTDLPKDRFTKVTVPGTENVSWQED